MRCYSYTAVRVIHVTADAEIELVDVLVTDSWLLNCLRLNGASTRAVYCYLRSGIDFINRLNLHATMIVSMREL